MNSFRLWLERLLRPKPSLVPVWFCPILAGMTELGRPFESHRPVKTKALAFYLPQFHPIPENDEWWGKGFTEWTNVAQARPLFPGHYQPHVPGELGYYDLRVPEVREAQAELARSHGVFGFVYYHYWFNGRRLLNRPFDEVLKSGSPDFPFALCWANEKWTRTWDGESGRVLIAQEYSEADDLAHIRWLASAFADPRYIKIDGRPLMLVYRPSDLPDPKRTTDVWRTEAERLGLPGLYLCWVEGWSRPTGGPESFGFDATVGFVEFLELRRLFTAETSMRGHRILDYVSTYEARLSRPSHPWKHFPAVTVGWDNTARHPSNATVFEGATPEHYRRWLERTVGSLADVREEENYLFIVAWNEWAEGNHLEPDLRFGRAFLEATRSVLAAQDPLTGPMAAVENDRDNETLEGPLLARPTNGQMSPSVATATAHLGELIDKQCGPSQRVIVSLAKDADVESTIALWSRIKFKALEGNPESVASMKAAGIDATQCDITDLGELDATLGDLGNVQGLLLLDVLEDIPEPQPFLEALSRWAIEHDNAFLFVSAPNVAHFDRGVSLLLGDWRPPEAVNHGGQPHFTNDTLEDLLEGCGWRRIDVDNVLSVRSGAWDAAILDSIPEEMVGALRVLSEAYNPYWAVERFVWALAPMAVTESPVRADAIVGPDSMAVRRGRSEQRELVQQYLDSIGLVASETDRRALVLRSLPTPIWKRTILRVAKTSPRLSSRLSNFKERLR